MRAFTELYRSLDETTKTNAKVAAMADYFARAAPADAAWAVLFLSGGRPKRLIAARRLGAWAAELAGVPDWLFDECYGAVGDLAETVALLLPESALAASCANAGLAPLHVWVEERLLPLRDLDDDAKRRAVLAAWSELDREGIFVWNKLITGAFRVGVSQRLVLRALERVSGVDAATLSHRLMGRWQPSAAAYQALFTADTTDADVARPYPFRLAHPLDREPGELGRLADWQAEWKWDGIRAQLVRRRGEVFLWSRGEELVTERYPDVAFAAKLLPDGVVVDGELLAWRDDAPLPFAELQRRIGRKKAGPKLLAEVPVALMAFDLLELDGRDLRERSLAERRNELARLLAAVTGTDRLLLSPRLEAAGWPELASLRAESRARRAEGLMLKRIESTYGVGRLRGDWWKWKVEPYTVDAVMLYAQRGHGRRASLYTDYTFAVRDGDRLVPFAKAYSGLTDAEIREVDRWVRRHTVERFGPVRAVDPELVFEIAFEGIRESTRHKSGIAVRFPRIVRWRRDKRPADADSLDTVRGLIDDGG